MAIQGSGWRTTTVPVAGRLFYDPNCGPCRFFARVSRWASRSRLTVIPYDGDVATEALGDLDDIPERLAPYEGKLALLRRISASIAAGQGSSFPTFFMWHRPVLSEFVVCRLEEWAGGSRKALGLGHETFAYLIRDLPGWEGEAAAPPTRTPSKPPATP